MIETYVWMALLLTLNWGGFLLLILRTMRKPVAPPKADDHECQQD